MLAAESCFKLLSMGDICLHLWEESDISQLWFEEEPGDYDPVFPHTCGAQKMLE